MRHYSAMLLAALVVILVSACQKETKVIEDNRPPYYLQIPNLLLENYINRTFIDLLGREPLDLELEEETQLLKTTNASEESRLTLIRKLQTDTAFIAEDSSYKRAYSNWFYESVKARFIEGASRSEIGQFIGPIQASIAVILAADSIDYENYYATVASLQRLLDLVSAEYGIFGDSLSLPALTKIMLDNQIYDEINMGSFNFVNASFDNCFYRFPSQSEFDNGYEMVEEGQYGDLLGENSYGKEGYLNILINSLECYQGWVVWCYRRLLQRDPTSEEINLLLEPLYLSGDIKEIEEHIIKSDEYAGF